MKIAEKIYIEWLEGMVKKYKGDLCDHCPKKMEREIVYIGDACDICIGLTIKYTGVGGVSDCPCHYFRDDKDVNMVKVAWKVIRGWKKDNK